MSLQDILKDKDRLQILSRAAFDAIDVQKNGYLEKKEIEALLINIAKDLNVKKPVKEEVDDIFKEINKDKTGRIHYDEFQSIIENVLQSMIQAEEANESNAA